MKLRVYQAGKGDCLLLTGTAGGNILIDGGVEGAFRTHVQPDLAKMAKRGEVLDLVYISHIDEDHIAGILEMLDLTMKWRVFDYRTSQGTARKPPTAQRMPEIKEIWHNAFSMQLEDNAAAAGTLLAQSSKLLSLSSDAEVLSLASTQHELAYSVEQAIRVSRRIAADQLAIPLNEQFGGRLILVRTPAGREARVRQMNVFVVGPFEEDVDILKEEWNTWLEKNTTRLAQLRAKAASDAAGLGNAAAGLQAVLNISLAELGDRREVTAPNLASVMLLVEEAGKRILLTGDGHADDIVAGLDFHGRFDANKRFKVDILKVQHHGAEFNINEEFCRRIAADHYVFCGNGMHKNPDLRALKLLLDTNLNERPTKAFKLWFNCASPQAPAGTPRKHMKAVEDLVAGYVNSPGRKVRAKFLSGSSFDLTI